MRNLSARLEALGQLRLPNIDILRDLVQIFSLPALVAAARSIKETARSITARIGRTLLVLAGDDREDYDAAGVEALITGMPDEDAVCALIGCGFAERGAA